jgi:hypothetical protein
MPECPVKPYVTVKRGDDFRIDFTIRNDQTEEALAAKQAWDDTLAADPLVPADVEAAKTAYENLIRVDIRGWTISSKVRWSTQLVDTLDVEIVDAAEGQFALTRGHADTETWPVKNLTCDVETLVAGRKTSSETFEVRVVEDITYG